MADHGDMTVLGLLDLAAAFDTVNHIVIDCLYTVFWICGSVLSWINSFIRMQMQTDIYNGMQSTRSVFDWMFHKAAY